MAVVLLAGSLKSVLIEFGRDVKIQVVVRSRVLGTRVTCSLRFINETGMTFTVVGDTLTVRAFVQTTRPLEVAPVDRSDKIFSSSPKPERHIFDRVPIDHVAYVATVRPYTRWRYAS